MVAVGISSGKYGLVYSAMSRNLSFQSLFDDGRSMGSTTELVNRKELSFARSTVAELPY